MATPNPGGHRQARRRAGISSKCRKDGKNSYVNRRTAARVAARLSEPAYVYWCPVAGAYHVTGNSPVDNDKLRAEHTPGRAAVGRVHAYRPNRAIPADHNGQRPCVCGRAKANRLHDPSAVAVVEAETAQAQAEHRRRIGEHE